MRKEVLVAILLGLGIGAVVALGIFTARKALTTTGGQPQQAGLTTPQAAGGQTNGSPTAAMEKSHSIAVTSPSDGLVTATEKITLSGTTTPGSTVAVTGGETDTVAAADDKGQFSAEIILIGGDNEIRIISFGPKGEKAEAVLTVVYSTAEF